MNTKSKALSALPALTAAVVESIAQEWDGCMCDAPGGEIDVGAAIRQGFPERWESLKVQQTSAVSEAAQRVNAYLSQHARAVRLDQEVLCVINPGSEAGATIRIADLRTLLAATISG